MANCTQGEVEDSLILFREFIEKYFPNALKEKNSGSFVLLNVQTKKIIQVIVNQIPTEKKEKYIFLAEEKAERLDENPDHLSSYESREEEYIFPINNQKWGKWGGAIRISDHYIFSFSGFPELLDETFVCFLALKYKFMKADYLKKIIQRRKNNPYLKKLKELF